MLNCPFISSKGHGSSWVNLKLSIHLKIMGIKLPVVLQAKQILRRSLANKLNSNVPKGYLAVYVGEMEKKRFLVPVSYLNQPSFQDLLRKAEEEFGFDHPMGGLTIPCAEDTFLDLTSQFDR
ncbi:Small auxin-up RNA [Dillenia turbinata]|uniref:Small auxin-up RNA n=1 Tax=Dillenia turbinata TaxID=194707 RepID=A0AAN8UVH5_9MAGN